MIGKTMGEGKDDPDALKKEIRHRAGRMQLLFLCLGRLRAVWRKKVKREA